MNLLRKLNGSPFLPSPQLIGFWTAKILQLSCTWTIWPNSGINISLLWSRIEFNPSKTFYGAKLRFFKITQCPFLSASSKGPGTNLNCPVAYSVGKSISATLAISSKLLFG